MSRVLMVVANGVDGDSRVLKMARAALDAGHEVTVLGRVKDGDGDERVLDGITVLRVAVPPVVSRYESRRLASRPGPDEHAAYRTARLTLAQWDRRAGVTRWWWRARTRTRALDAVLRVLSTGAPGGWLWAAATALRGLLGRHGGWRALNPWTRDLELAMAPQIERLRPDLVHAHDFHTVGIVARAVARLNSTGVQTRWVYDAHEYLAGVEAPRWSDLRRRMRTRMLVGSEAEYIGAADAVITVSGEIAQLLQRDHGLRATPEVVLNAPPRARSAGVRGIRQAVAVGEDVPLLVYAGGLSPRRGLSTVIEGLRALDGVHLALVARSDDADLPALLDQARAVGVSDRLHVAPYVDPFDVPAYLAGASAGLIPLLHHPNHELSLITKWFEYAQAGLPLIVSDVRVMAAETRRLGVGSVFTAGERDAFVEAARTVLADPGGFRVAWQRQSALLDALSWEHQSQRLLALYRRLGCTP